MDKEKIIAACDHTNLKPEATWKDIEKLCDEARKYHAASVCIPASYVKRVAESFGGNPKVCTVIGFPTGYATTEVKVAETKQAVEEGAEEIDMVINIGALKDGRNEAVLEEIKQVKEACDGKILKVIVETCLLTEEEKIRICKIMTEAGADYIKTSTGFSTGGATVEDVKLFKENIGADVKIKAAGGIATFEDAEALLEAGADRIGTSRLIGLL